MSQELGHLAVERAFLRTPSPEPPAYMPQSKAKREKHYYGVCRRFLFAVAALLLVSIFLSNVAFWIVAANVRNEYLHLKNITAHAEALLPVISHTLAPFEAISATIAIHQYELDRAIVEFPTFERNVQELLDLARELANKLSAKRTENDFESSFALQNTAERKTLPLWSEERID